MTTKSRRRLDGRKGAVPAPGDGGETPPVRPARTPARRPLHDYLTLDHERLDALLAASVRDDGSIDEASFFEFRRGLLRHIGIEERVLFPLLRNELTQRLHRDHAALAALLVPPPTRAEVEQIRAILEEHNPLEEDRGGFYDQVEALVDMEKVRAYPEVRTAPYTDSPLLRQTIEQLLRERKP